MNIIKNGFRFLRPVLFLLLALFYPLLASSCGKKKFALPEIYYTAELFSVDAEFNRLLEEYQIQETSMGELRNGYFDANGSWIKRVIYETKDSEQQHSTGLVEFNAGEKSFRFIPLLVNRVQNGNKALRPISFELCSFLGKTPDDSFVLIERTPRYDEEGLPINPAGPGKFYLTCYSAEGVLLSSTSLYDIDPRLGVFDTMYLSRCATLSASGIVYLQSDPENGGARDLLVAAVTPDGELLSTVQVAEVCPAYRSGTLRYSGVLTSADGEDCLAFSRVNEGGRTAVCSYDQLLREKEVYPVSFRQALGGDPIWFSDTDVYFSTPFGIYHEEINGEGYDTLLSWLDIDLSGRATVFGNDLNNMYFPSPDAFCLAYVDPFSYASYFITVTHSDTPVETDKKILTIAYDESNYADGHADALDSFLNLASSFNLQSETHRIRVIPYANDGVSTANEKLKLDLVSGRVPDMILFGGSITPDPFVRMEEFVDLYKFMDADDTYTRDAFLPCVLEPFETAKGQLPYLVLNFNLRTSMGLRAQVGDKTVWTLDDFENALNNLGENQYLIKLGEESEDARMAYFASVLPAVVNQYVDYEKKKCDFGGDFQRLLELCGSVRAYASDGNLLPEAYSEGDVLLMDYTLATADEYLKQKYLLSLGEDIRLIGAPRSDGAAYGTAIAWDMALAITRTCDDSAGAWEFIRFYLDGCRQQTENLSENPQTMSIFRGFKPTWQCADILLQLMSELEFFAELRETDIGIRFVSSTWTFQLRAPENPQDSEEFYRLARRKTFLEKGYADLRFTESDEALFHSLFANCTAVWSRDDAVLDILYEEASAYFAGAKSLDDTIRLMENRVKTRINE